MKTRLLTTLLTLLLLMFGLQGTAFAAVPPTELTWYGQSAFKLVTPAGHVLFIDPWIVNPLNKNGKDDLAKIDRADLILISHGHFDHVGQAMEIANKTKARLVATLDLGGAIAKYGGYPKDQMSFETLGNFGGVLNFFDEVRIAFVPALHSSTVNGKELGVNDDDESHFAGAPGGFVIMVKGGPTIYHTGDTDLFADMINIAKYGKIDLMLACIGDHFTMGPERAALAVGLVNPGKVVPMHYGTVLPMMTGTPDKFARVLDAKGLSQKFMPMTVGKPITF